MARLNIEQRDEQDVTVIEGTAYANSLLRILGRDTVDRGPFVIESHCDGTLSIRKISRWPEYFTGGVIQ